MPRYFIILRRNKEITSLRVDRTTFGVILLVFSIRSIKMYLEIISGVLLLGSINGQDQNREGKWLLYPRTITSFVHEKSYVTESVASSCVAIQPSLPPCRHVRQLDIRPYPTEKWYWFQRHDTKLKWTFPCEDTHKKDEWRQEEEPNLSNSRKEIFSIVRGQVHCIWRTGRARIKITASPELLGVPERTAAGLMYGPRVIFSSNGHRENLERQDNDPKPLSWAEYLGLEDVTVTKTAVHSVTAKYYDPNTVVTFNVRGCHPSKLPFNLPLCNNNATSSTAAVNSLAKEVHYAPYN